MGLLLLQRLPCKRACCYVVNLLLLCIVILGAIGGVIFNCRIGRRVISSGGSMVLTRLDARASHVCCPCGVLANYGLCALRAGRGTFVVDTWLTMI